MALDVYVMPLWRFKAGEFTTPLEATFGMKPMVISPVDPSPPVSPWYLRLLARSGIIKFVSPSPEPSPEERRAVAGQEVDALKAQLTEITGTPIKWPDNGDVHYNRQFGDPSVLRAFAAWHDHRKALPEFLNPAELRYDKHPVWKLPKPVARCFPALAAHSLYIGYFLPVPFEGVYHVEPFKVWEKLKLFHDVASTQTIMRELSGLLEFIATVPEVREQEYGSIPVGDARWYAEELQRICALSIEHRLPVIFHG